MKKMIAIVVACMSLVIGAQHVFAAGKACTPTNISYCKKSTTILGKKYSTYTVRCSDGTKRTISAWDGRETWCVGEVQKNCTNDQLKAAKKACSGE